MGSWFKDTRAGVADKNKLVSTTSNAVEEIAQVEEDKKEEKERIDFQELANSTNEEAIRVYSDNEYSHSLSFDGGSSAIGIIALSVTLIIGVIVFNQIGEVLNKQSSSSLSNFTDSAHIQLNNSSGAVLSSLIILFPIVAAVGGLIAITSLFSFVGYR